MKTFSFAAIATGLMLAASPAMADVTPGYTVKISGDNSGASADTPTFLVTNTSTFTGASATDAFITNVTLTFAGPAYIDRLTGFTTPTPPVQTLPNLGYTVNTPDGSSNNMGTPGFNIDFTGFNAGDAFRFQTDFDQAGGSNANYRSVLNGASLNVTFGNGSTQSLTLGGFNATQVDYTFSGANAVAAAVPEPTAWAMMIGGFGVVGGSLRRRASASKKLALA